MKPYLLVLFFSIWIHSCNSADIVRALMAENEALRKLIQIASEGKANHILWDCVSKCLKDQNFDDLVNLTSTISPETTTGGMGELPTEAEGTTPTSEEEAPGESITTKSREPNAHDRTPRPGPSETPSSSESIGTESSTSPDQTTTATKGTTEATTTPTPRKPNAHDRNPNNDQEVSTSTESTIGTEPTGATGSTDALTEKPLIPDSEPRANEQEQPITTESPLEGSTTGIDVTGSTTTKQPSTERDGFGPAEEPQIGSDGQEPKTTPTSSTISDVEPRTGEPPDRVPDSQPVATSSTEGSTTDESTTKGLAEKPGEPKIGPDDRTVTPSEKPGGSSESTSTTTASSTGGPSIGEETFRKGEPFSPDKTPTTVSPNEATGETSTSASHQKVIHKNKKITGPNGEDLFEEYTEYVDVDDDGKRKVTRRKKVRGKDGEDKWEEWTEYEDESQSKGETKSSGNTRKKKVTHRKKTRNENGEDKWEEWTEYVDEDQIKTGTTQAPGGSSHHRKVIHHSTGTKTPGQNEEWTEYYDETSATNGTKGTNKQVHKVTHLGKNGEDQIEETVEYVDENGNVISKGTTVKPEQETESTTTKQPSTELTGEPQIGPNGKVIPTEPPKASESSTSPTTENESTTLSTTGESAAPTNLEATTKAGKEKEPATTIGDVVTYEEYDEYVDPDGKVVHGRNKSVESTTISSTHKPIPLPPGFSADKPLNPGQDVPHLTTDVAKEPGSNKEGEGLSTTTPSSEKTTGSTTGATTTIGETKSTLMTPTSKSLLGSQTETATESSETSTSEGSTSESTTTSDKEKPTTEATQSTTSPSTDQPKSKEPTSTKFLEVYNHIDDCVLPSLEVAKEIDYPEFVDEFKNNKDRTMDRMKKWVDDKIEEHKEDLRNTSGDCNTQSGLLKAKSMKTAMKLIEDSYVLTQKLRAPCEK
ncbi:unnamed protein product, partial [Mesorhabditis belari]|uniref:Uncharacterized protein n=1 Tax=Mesorhabditis belari TaxID=2138241 RepID=A0AAF3ELJ4_9BILA